MRALRFPLAVLGLVLAVLAVGCFTPRPEKPKERIHRIRLGYRVSADWYENRTGKDGKPELVMSLRCTNTGRDSLKVVTLILHIRHFDGSERIAQPLSLDVTKVKPDGKSWALGEVVVPGLDVREGEELALQLEVQPAEAQMKVYPEYAELFTASDRAK